MWVRRREGQSVTELALILPTLLLLLAVVFDVGRAMLLYGDLVHAAREGAWVASDRPWDSAGIQQAVVRALQDAGLNPGAATITIDKGGAGEPVSVRVDYPYDPFLPFLPFDTITLSARHTMVRMH